jgi:hypothetical protein
MYLHLKKQLPGKLVDLRTFSTNLNNTTMKDKVLHDNYRISVKAFKFSK